MAKPYLPKIKMKTVLSTAQKIGATTSGKQISQTAFKKFLKQEKDLKKYSYAAPTSTMAKQKAQKFFGQVASKIAQQKNLKISYFAKKNLGIKVGSGGDVSQIATNKAYQAAASEETKQMEPKGPNPEEIAKQERRKEAFKTLRQRERADEVRKEQLPQDKSVKPEKTGGNHRPVQIQGGAGHGTAAKSQTKAGASDDSTAIKSSKSKKSALATVAVLPLNNLSQNKHLDLAAEKLTTAICRIIGSYKKFELLEKSRVEKATSSGAYASAQRIMTLDTAREIQNKLNVDFIIIGDLQKAENQTQIKIKILKIGEFEPTKIAEIKKETEDVFELEKHVGWYISNYFESLPRKLRGFEPEEKSKNDNIEIPPTSKAEDLPI